MLAFAKAISSGSCCGGSFEGFSLLNMGPFFALLSTGLKHSGNLLSVSKCFLQAVNWIKKKKKKKNEFTGCVEALGLDARFGEADVRAR